MENHNIIDTGLDSGFKISNRAIAILKIGGLFALILCILYIIEIITSGINLYNQFSTFTSISDDYSIYIIANIGNSAISTILNVFLIIYLFRFWNRVQPHNLGTIMELEWAAIFRNIKMIFLLMLFNILNIVMFNFVYIIIGFII